MIVRCSGGIDMEEKDGFLEDKLIRLLGTDSDLNEMFFNIIIFKIFSPKTFLKMENQLLLEAKQKINQLFMEKKDVIKFSPGKNEMTILLIGKSLEDLDNVQYKYLDSLLCIMNTYCRLDYFGGIGKTVKGVSELIHSREEAARAFTYRFIWDCSLFLDYRQIPKKQEYHGDKSKKSSEIAHFDKSKIDAFLQQGNLNEVSAFVMEYLKNIGSSSMDSFLFRQYMVMDSYFIVVNFVEDMGYDSGKIERPLGESAKMMLAVMSFEFMYEYLVYIFTQAIQLRDEFDLIYKI